MWLGICAVDDSVPKIQERERKRNIIKSKKLQCERDGERGSKRAKMSPSCKAKPKKEKGEQSDTLPFRTNGQLHRHGAGGGGGVSVQVSLSESLQTRARA